MKYILILLVSFLFGQIDSSKTFYKDGNIGIGNRGHPPEVVNPKSYFTVEKGISVYDIEHYEKVFKENGLITFELYGVESFIPTVLSYEIYAEECYNDSTAVTFGYFRDWDTGKEYKSVYRSRSGVIDIGLQRTEEGFVHKQPTFQGFIEWLEN